MSTFVQNCTVMNNLCITAMSGILSLATLNSFSQEITGTSSSQSPYLKPAQAGVRFASIITAGDAINGYKMVGIPDGLGAFDNGNGTFTLLVNHELGNSLGKVRAHGSKGAFVSRWIINKSNLAVVKGEDLMKKVHLWDAATSSYFACSASYPSSLAAFNRFCSADLPAVTAFYNTATGLGTTERIFMNGEEAGAEGRAMAHIVTGPNAGNSYELPYLGKFSWENSVANPFTGTKTVVAGMDDATPGQVYFYIGEKTNTGTEIEKAGLTNGQLFGVVVNGLSVETNDLNTSQPGTFKLANLDFVKNQTGAQLQSRSDSAGVMQFLRPEDGAWDPSNPTDFYFNTTNSFTGPSRLWKLHFNNLNDLTQGGTINVVLNGTEGQKMLDNMAIDSAGHILLQEDVGNNAHLGKIWQYNIKDKQLVEVAVHDSTRFLLNASNYLTQDEESSGIIDVSAILGPGMFLTTVQAHFGLPGEIVEGGQLLAFYNPYVIPNKLPAVKITNPIAGNAYTAASNINFDVAASDTDGTIVKVIFYSNGIKLKTDSAPPYRYEGINVEANDYLLTAVAFDNKGDSAISAPVKVTVTGCTGSGSISAEGYVNITGAAVADLTSDPAFPGRPSVIRSLTEFEYGQNLGDHYGARVRGYVCAPETGYYTFFISADDQAGLWLSTNDNPANKKLIAYNIMFTGFREWYKYPTQKSEPVYLVKGGRYYIETLHKEYTTFDHLSVAWAVPNIGIEAPIMGSHLSPFTAGTVRGGRAGNDFRTAMEQLTLSNDFVKKLTASAAPNPSASYFTLSIKSNSGSPVAVTIFDIMGRKTESKPTVAANGEIIIGNKLQPGIYFVEVVQDGKKERIKIVKQ